MSLPLGDGVYLFSHVWTLESGQVASPIPFLFSGCVRVGPDPSAAHFGARHNPQYRHGYLTDLDSLYRYWYDGVSWSRKSHTCDWCTRVHPSENASNPTPRKRHISFCRVGKSQM